MLRQSLRLRPLVQAQTVCIFCQHRSTAPLLKASLSTTTSHRNNDLTFLEKTRRRIWGTDNPPGADDPYTGQSRPKKLSSHESINQFEDDLTPEEFEVLARREEKELFQQSIDDALEHNQYTPSETWDGLEVVGGEVEWDQGRVFQGFSSIEKLRDPAQLTVALHRATVEVLAITNAGYDSTKLLKPISNQLVDDTAEIIINPSSDGSTIQLQWPDENVRQRVLQSLGVVQTPNKTNDIDEELSRLESDEDMQNLQLVQLTASRLDSGWLSTPLSNSTFKLSVVSRFNQITGIHLPDPLIQSSATLGALLSAIIQRLQKPKTVYQAIAAKGALLETSNVRVMHRRETPVDREKKLGRWKVIERELRARDLPVLGKV